jgi:hypothetical protein
MRDERVRASLERVPVPAERSRFLDELWQKAEAGERRAARRWRRTSVVLAVIIVAAGTAAGVLAVGRAGGAKVVDRTIGCRVVTNLDSGTLELAAQVRLPPRYAGGGVISQPGSVTASSPQLLYAAASSNIFANGRTAKSGYYFDESICQNAHAIPFVHTGLSSLGDFSRAGQTEFSEACDVARNSMVTVRLRVVLDSAGAPTAARLAIRAGRRQRPAAFVDWTPAAVRAWVAPGCIAH